MVGCFLSWEIRESRWDSHLAGWLSFVLWRTGLDDSCQFWMAAILRTRFRFRSEPASSSCSMTLGYSLNLLMTQFTHMTGERIPVYPSGFLSRSVAV